MRLAALASVDGVAVTRITAERVRSRYRYEHASWRGDRFDDGRIQ